MKNARQFLPWPGVMLAVSLFAAQSVHALAWRPVGPYGASTSNAVTAALITSGSPSRAYVGTTLVQGDTQSIDGTFAGELFRSVDGGASWNVLTGWGGGGLLTLVQSPTDANTIFAGSYFGAFRSTDAGTTWVAINNGFVDFTNAPSTEQVQALALNPYVAGTLYAGTSDAGLYKSTDSGDSWVKSVNGLFFPGIRDVAIDPVNPSVLYAATDGGLFKSIDDAANWSSSNSGLSNLQVRSIAIHPSNSQTVWVAVSSPTADASVFRSTNGGTTWSLSSSGLSCVEVADLVLDSADPSTLYAVGSNGVCRSVDSGVSWASVGASLGSTDVRSITVDPSVGSKLIVGTAGGSGLYTSTDAGDTWLAAANGLHATSIGTIAHGAQSTRLYASSPDGAGVFYADLFGNSWASMNFGLTDLSVTALAYSHTEAPFLGSTLDIVYAGGESGVFRIEASDNPFTSQWSELLNQPAATNPRSILAVDDPNHPVLFVAGDSLSRSADEGTTWGTSLFDSTRTVAAHSATTYYTEAVYRSADRGVSWAATIDGLPSGRGLLVDSDGTSKVFLAYENTSDPVGVRYQVYSATDDGVLPVEWSLVSASLPDDREITALTVETSTTIWVGIREGGVYRTTDGGASWQEISAGLTNQTVVDIALAEVPLVATGSGIFRANNCGDGVLDSGEACDDGNSAPGDCCASDCSIEPSTTVCRASANDCDVAESCNGASSICPTDQQVANGTSCGDGNACTQVDQCVDGECVGSPVTCNDGEHCTNDSCNPSLGCVFVNNTVSCDDGSACTSNDVCSDGTCAGAPTVVCDDSNPCTLDTCNELAGCVFTAHSGACNDGDVCTVGEVCAAGVCGGGSPATCNDGEVCTDDTCAPGVGCTFVPNTASCSDGNACTLGDVCSNGNCVGASFADCSDGNTCTTDSCAPDGGCIHTANSNACDDEDFQTCNDTCAAGTCGGTFELNGCIDSFKCYRTRSDDFERIVGVEVDDAFQSDIFFDVTRPSSLCNPVDRNGAGIGDATAHLACYDVKLTNADPRQQKFASRDIQSNDPLGVHALTLRGVESICLPATVDGVASVLDLDAFKCYATRAPALPSAGTTNLSDQFAMSTSASGLRPASVCLPASVENTPLRRADTSLGCYRMRETPRFGGSNASIESSLGATAVEVRAASTLCLPAGVSSLP